VIFYLGDYLVVLGGLSDDYLQDVAIVNLSNDGKTCTPLPDYPVAAYELAATFYDGKLVSCSGYPLTGRCF